MFLSYFVVSLLLIIVLLVALLKRVPVVALLKKACGCQHQWLEFSTKKTIFRQCIECFQLEKWDYVSYYPAVWMEVVKISEIEDLARQDLNIKRHDVDLSKNLAKDAEWIARQSLKILEKELKDNRASFNESGYLISSD